MSQFNPIERIGIHRVALIFLEQYGWIEREQPISDFGIDMHLEIVDDGTPTGQIFALQIKSGESYFSESTSENYIYRGTNKHLDYWLSQSVPVLIVIYNPREDKAYWEHVKPVNVIKTNVDWKIKIPKGNDLNSSKSQIKLIYHNPKHHTVMEVGDSSHRGARRVDAKILVESTHAQSRNAMKKMIPEIINKFMKSDYHRNEITREQYEGMDAEVVFLFFYNSIQQVNRGLMFARAIWNNPDCQYPLTPFKADEIIEGIEVKWDSEFSELGEFIANNELSKGDYLEKANSAFSHVNGLFTSVTRIFKNYETDGEFEVLRNFIGSKETEFELLINSPLESGFAPLECEQIDRIIRESEALMHNIWIVATAGSRDEGNITYLIRNYLKEVGQKIEYYEYELKKIK